MIRRVASQGAIAFTPQQAGEIMRVLKQNKWRKGFARVAKSYAKKRLPEPTKTGIQLIVLRLFMLACRDYLFRDSGVLGRVYSKDADALDAAAHILKANDRKFRELSTLLNILYAGPGTTGPTQPQKLISLASQISQISASYREIASHLSRDKINITFFYCLGRQFNRRVASEPLRLPTPDQAWRIWVHLFAAIREVVPEKFQAMKRYDPRTDSKEIRRSMISGAKGNPPSLTTRDSKVVRTFVRAD